EMTLPIFAMVMAPESVSTTLHSGSWTMASRTSRASPRLRPLNAVLDIARRSPANDSTRSRSRLSSATNPSPRPSWKSRCAMAASLHFLVRLERLRERLEFLYRHYDHRFVDPDPLEFVRRQTTPADREVVGLIAAVLAYGNVLQIKRSIGK